MSSDAWRDRLDAYVDGELPDGEVRPLEEHLGTCHACAAEALKRMQMKRATHLAAMRFTPSPEFRERIRKSIAPKRHRFSFPMITPLAVAALLLVVVGISTWIAMRRTAREQTVAQLLDMHVAALASPNPVDVVSSDRHTVKPWFQGKLPFTFNLPELQGSQYTLLGGKLVYFQGKPAAQLIYALKKHEFSVFIVQDSASAALADARQNGFSTESWTAGGLRYVAMSDAGAADVHALGDLLRSVQQP
jgi:anti-sigma factor RsiW